MGYHSPLINICGYEHHQNIPTAFEIQRWDAIILKTHIVDLYILSYKIGKNKR